MASIVPDDRGVLRGFSRTCHNRRLRRFLRARTAATQRAAAPRPLRRVAPPSRARSRAAPHRAAPRRAAKHHHVTASRSPPGRGAP